MNRAVWGYAAAVVALWLTLQLLVDRTWPATLIAFGPRWLLLLPAIPLLAIIVLRVEGRSKPALMTVVVFALGMVVFGVMDFRLGLQRASGVANLRVMTQNLGESVVTAERLDAFLRAEEVDVAALQECPFYDLKPARLGWHFYYAGDLCLASRFPFSVVAGADPTKPWRASGRSPMLFEIETPTGSFRLLVVHFETIRGGIEGLRTRTQGGFRDFLVNRDDSARESQTARAMVTDARPVVVAGDFNLPVESVIYRADWSGFQNVFSRCGRGFGYTKSTLLHAIRIDHVLASQHWVCTDARVLRSPYGGDHAPVVVDLRLQ